MACHITALDRLNKRHIYVSRQNRMGGPALCLNS